MRPRWLAPAVDAARAAVGAVVRRPLPGHATAAERETRGDAQTERARAVDALMRDYVERNPADAFAGRSYPFDRLRFVRSVAWLDRLGLHGQSVLELGASALSSHVLRALYPAATFTTCTADLRGALPHADGAFDVVLAMEVIEHVADVEYMHATVLSGVQNALAETARVLRVGGSLLLTTPNAASLLVIERVLRGEAPWFYPWHFREFTAHELAILVEESGLHVRQLEAEFVWSEPGPAWLVELLRAHGLPADGRGDDLFMWAEKRPERATPRGKLDLPLP